MDKQMEKTKDRQRDRKTEKPKDGQTSGKNRSTENR